MLPSARARHVSEPEQRRMLFCYAGGEMLSMTSQRPFFGSSGPCVRGSRRAVLKGPRWENNDGKRTELASAQSSFATTLFLSERHLASGLRLPLGRRLTWFVAAIVTARMTTQITEHWPGFHRRPRSASPRFVVRAICRIESTQLALERRNTAVAGQQSSNTSRSDR